MNEIRANGGRDKPRVERFAALVDRMWRTGSAIAEAAANEDHIRLAVTGLSRAGKTVFITSLIHNLLALGQRKNTLPRLAQRLAAGTGGGHDIRLLEVTMLPAGAEALPRFDYVGHLAGLASEPPFWPERTDDVAQISLTMILERRSQIGRKIGPRRVRLDILDYPGEWLLDLPMLGQSFPAWSEATFALLHQKPRLEVFRPFLEFMEGVRPGDRADDTVARQGHELYRSALEVCRVSHGLRYLQPGRFLCPGQRADVPFMWFFPMEGASAPPVRGTLAALLSERFEAYKRDMRTNFFEPWFDSFDRQVMLVDVLGALHAGRAAFEDTARALRDIAGALRYSGHVSLIETAATGLVQSARQILPSAFGAGTASQRKGTQRINRVVFVATKADHVPALKRDNLRHLLRALSDPAVGHQKNLGASVTHQVVASLLATEDGSAKLDGRAVQVVRGVKLGEDKVRSFYVGEVPTNMPSADFWSEPFFELPRFRPPALDPAGAKGLPHLGLDLVLDDLLGDLL